MSLAEFGADYQANDPTALPTAPREETCAAAARRTAIAPLRRGGERVAAAATAPPLTVTPGSSRRAGVTTTALVGMVAVGSEIVLAVRETGMTAAVGLRRAPTVSAS